MIKNIVFSAIYNINLSVTECNTLSTTSNTLQFMCTKCEVEDQGDKFDRFGRSKVDSVGSRF